MKKISFILFFILLMCGFSFAQKTFPEFEKAAKIKLLQSTREDVRKIFAGFETEDDEFHEQYFSNKNAEIAVTFSAGKCADEDSEEIWNVAEWKVTKIKITPEETLKLEGFKFDFSSFKKEIRDEEYPDYFIYHDENAGIVFEIDEGEIQKIIFYPPKSNIAFLCVNETTAEIISGEKRLVDFILEKEVITCGINQPPNVTELSLSADEIIIGCKDAKIEKTCSDSNRKILIMTSALDPESDPLLYNYEISVGKIIGQGKEIVWDLTGVPSGTYTITAWVDDGCGRCGQEVTKTVIVRECSECSQDQKSEPEKP